MPKMLVPLSQVKPGDVLPSGRLVSRTITGAALISDWYPKDICLDLGIDPEIEVERDVLLEPIVHDAKVLYDDGGWGLTSDSGSLSDVLERAGWKPGQEFTLTLTPKEPQDA